MIEVKYDAALKTGEFRRMSRVMQVCLNTAASDVGRERTHSRDG